MSDTNHNLLKSAGRVGLLTTLSRVFGYARDATLALVLGAGLGMDAFTIAFRLSNLFRRLVAEGAMSSAFIPVFVSLREKKSASELWDFARKFFYTLAVIVTGIVVLEIIFAPLIVKLMAPGFVGDASKYELTVTLTRLMAPYLLFVALAALLMGVLNSLNHFSIPALSPVCFNLSVILSAFTLARMTSNPAIGIAMGVLMGGLLQFLIQVPVALQKGMRFSFGLSFNSPAVKEVIRLLMPSLFGIGIIQVNLLVDSVMGSLLGQGSVSHLYYADRIMELVLGVFVMSLATVILPSMSEAAAKKNINELKSTLLFSLRTISFVAVPATVGLFVLAQPIIHVLFERGQFKAIDTEQTASTLAFYAVGLCFISGSRLLVNAFYATKDTKTPVKVAGIILIANIVLNWILMQPLKQGGIALATSLASLFGFILLQRAFSKQHGKSDVKDLKSGLFKIGLAALVMGSACPLFLKWGLYGTFSGALLNALALFGAISGSIFVYLVMAKLLKVNEIEFIKQMNLFGKK